MADGGPLRLGIVGCGRIVERGYFAAVQKAPGIRLAALADPDRERLARCGRLWEQAAREPVRRYDDVETLLVSGSADALVVAAPAAEHAGIAALAAEAAIPCLVEKPPGGDLAGASALATLEPVPAIGFNRRFLQGAELAPNLPATGWLEIDLELRFRRDAWGAHVCRDEALLDAGVHLIDLAAFLSGSAPIAVRGAKLTPERASLELEMGRGRARIRCATDRAYAERAEVRDRAGRVIASSRQGRLRAALTRVRDGEEPLVLSLRRQLECFAAVAQGGDGGALAKAEAAVVAMSAVEAARRSAAFGGAEVTVPIPAPVAGAA